ncbi:JAB domain-containing protein [Vallitalea okinawensis]|uniref:JAB domain-containing protein n=1 Tax=Vallitalea okinawensis TaxID=2078660 RepID=UPI000CFB02F0|nr:JAB domain-containing protein [Vallitalea okinawensis]
MSKEPRKRVEVVKLVRESSFLYEPRKISSPQDGLKLIGEFLTDLYREAVLVVSLDTKNQPITINICSIGSINSSIIHPREVFKAAILSNAVSIIIGHYHPTNCTMPSLEDKEVMNRIKEVGEIIGIPLLDHIIIESNSNSYTSLREIGVL